MQDYQFVNFFLGHDAGQEARDLLARCGLLDVALANRANRMAWWGDLHTGVSLRLPAEDERLRVLLAELTRLGVEPLKRLDREYSANELNSASWLLLRVATAGLWGGIDYGQTYDFSRACGICGAGVSVVPPLLAELGSMGKKDADHLVYEGHLIVSSRLAEGLAGLSGAEPAPVRTQRRPPDNRHAWLKITNTLPKMHDSTLGYSTEGLCPRCGRAGHYGDAHCAEMPRYSALPTSAPDFNLTWEYFGDWKQRRHDTHLQTIGGAQGIVVSQRVRQCLLKLKVRRLVWVPVGLVESATASP